MSEARTRASRKWNEANLTRLYVTAHKAEGEAIKAAAEAAGESVNAYILEAVRRRLATESQSVQSPE